MLADTPLVRSISQSNKDMTTEGLKKAKERVSTQIGKLTNDKELDEEPKLMKIKELESKKCKNNFHYSNFIL